MKRPPHACGPGLQPGVAGARWWGRGALAAALAAALVGGCEREDRGFNGRAPASNIAREVRLTGFQPGPPQPTKQFKNPYEQKAAALSEGKTLFKSFNCNGCHANGGGGMGPPLIDDAWRYGSDPEQVYLTIIQGRPNGMPSFGGKLTEDQAWKLVAYVRSMSGLVRKDAAPGRDDHMKSKPPENSMPHQEPKDQPGSAEQPG